MSARAVRGGAVMAAAGGLLLAVVACGRSDGRADTAAAADSAVEAARAEVDTSVPLPDTLTPTVPPPSAGEGVRPAPSGGTLKGPATRGNGGGTTGSTGPGTATTRPASRPAGTGAPGGAQGSDTVRGKPAVVGSAPFTQVALRPASGGSVTITGPLATEIGRASGADVWVKGRRTDRGLEATDYRVRTVDGVPAHDGVLLAEGEVLYLRLADGSRLRLQSPPAALRQEAGARVWVTGGVDQPVAAFGILRPRS